MTLQQTLSNLPEEQKNQTKQIIFQQGNNSQPSFGNSILTIYDYDNRGSMLLKENLDLSHFPNLRLINFKYNVRANSLESIDISKNQNLSKIILGQSGQQNPLRETSAILTVKKNQLNQIVIFATYYAGNSWHDDYKLLKKQPEIPYILVEDKENEILEAEIKELREKVEDLQRKAEQTPTFAQFQELNKLALFSDEPNFEELKEEIRRLKLKDFTPHYQKMKESFKKLIRDCETDLSEELRSTLKLFLKTNEEILKTQEDQRNSSDPIQLRKQGQLDGQMVFCQTFLQHKLSDERLQDLLVFQEKFLQIEKEFASLQREEQHIAEIVQNNPPVYRP